MGLIVTLIMVRVFAMLASVGGPWRVKILKALVFFATLVLSVSSKAATEATPSQPTIPQSLFNHLWFKSSHQPSAMPMSNSGAFEEFRASAPRYWREARSLANSYFSKSMLVEGIVTGDPHILNITDSRISHQRRLTLVDIDDGGRAPLILDFARFALGNSVSEVSVHFDSLWRAYVEGLKGYAMTPPDFVLSALELSNEHEANLEAKFIKKVSDDDQFDYGKAKLKPLSAATDDIETLWGKVRPTLVKALGGAEILDIGYRTKDSGGSRGMVRFWFLIRDPRTQAKQVIEFKQLQVPATAMYSPQPETSRRIALVNHYYRNAANDPNYGVVSAGSQYFWMRPRLPHLLDFEDTPETPEDIQAYQKMMLYLANWLGQKQFQQPESTQLLDAIESAPSTAKSAVQLFIQGMQ